MNGTSLHGKPQATANATPPTPAAGRQSCHRPTAFVVPRTAKCRSGGPFSAPLARRFHFGRRCRLKLVFLHDTTRMVVSGRFLIPHDNGTTALDSGKVSNGIAEGFTFGPRYAEGIFICPAAPVSSNPKSRFPADISNRRRYSSRGLGIVPVVSVRATGMAGALASVSNRPRVAFMMPRPKPPNVAVRQAQSGRTASFRLPSW
jgi:hypothetical protein